MKFAGRTAHLDSWGNVHNRFISRRVVQLVVFWLAVVVAPGGAGCGGSGPSRTAAASGGTMGGAGKPTSSGGAIGSAGAAAPGIGGGGAGGANDRGRASGGVGGDSGAGDASGMGGNTATGGIGGNSGMAGNKGAAGGGASCSRAALKSAVDGYFTGLAARTASSLPVAPNVKFTENGKISKVGQDGLWKTAGMLKFRVHRRAPRRLSSQRCDVRF